MSKCLRLINVILLFCLANVLLLFGVVLDSTPLWVNVIIIIALVLWFLCFNFFPYRSGTRDKRLKIMMGGYELFITVGWASLAEIILHIALFCNLPPDGIFGIVVNLLVMLPVFFLVAANAFFRIIFTSQQLRILWRVMLAIFWWFPLLNLYIFWRVCHIVKHEYLTEISKLALDEARAENEVCKTRYPLVLVHGIFFRDWQLVNYWGRIPNELIRNGADIHYGGQQSAAAVSQSAEELKATVLKVLKETGAEKVNLIAHSKGGLDARYAITRLGLAPYVASLTTINTPHRGCIFAQSLLKRLPKKVIHFITEKYNAVFHTLGDRDPDFLAGVVDLTAAKCAQFNKDTPDMPEVLYQSVMSTMKGFSSAPFPLNLTWLLVKKYDKEPNDGLVALSSAPWGNYLGNLTVPHRRGLSHGDIIDLVRENIPGFDVREYYVELVKGLKEQGL